MKLTEKAFRESLGVLNIGTSRTNKGWAEYKRSGDHKRSADAAGVAVEKWVHCAELAFNHGYEEAQAEVSKMIANLKKLARRKKFSLEDIADAVLS